MGSRKVFAATLLFIFVCFGTLAAQTSTGEVNGTVTDPNGGGVPNAQVKLVSQKTKIETSATTNDSGYFVFVNVKPSTYLIRVEVTGFKKAITVPFDIGVNETTTQNIAL